MALIYKTQESETGGFSWQTWYQKNKGRLAEKKAKLYRDDPAYRAAALKRSRQQRGTKKTPVTDGHTVSFNDAAHALDVTVWVLREWRRKSYFPEPHHRDGRLWFSPAQVELLTQVQKFLDQHGSRVTNETRPELDSIVSLVYANWQ